MIFLSPFLLSISSNLNTLTVSLSYGIKKIHLTKSSHYFTCNNNFYWYISFYVYWQINFAFI